MCDQLRSDCCEKLRSAHWLTKSASRLDSPVGVGLCSSSGCSRSIDCHAVIDSIEARMMKNTQGREKTSGINSRSRSKPLGRGVEKPVTASVSGS